MSQAAHSADPTTVRTAAPADIEAMAASLARAFHDDPMMLFVLRHLEDPQPALPRVFRLLAKLAMPYGACEVTPGYEAASLWRPPGKWHMHWWDYVFNGVEFVGIFGRGIPRVMAAMDLVESRHPKVPHWYLQVIGTDPAHQGKGFAGKLMRKRLAEVDAAGLPAYLESSKDTNIPIYRSFGFEVTGEIKVPDGPTLWPMWRPARV